jgi:hypothetical protein
MSNQTVNTATKLPQGVQVTAPAPATKKYTERIMLNNENVTDLFSHDEMAMLYEAIQPPPKNLRSKASGVIAILESMPDKSTILTVDMTNGDKTDTIGHLLETLKDAQNSPAQYRCHTAKGKKKGSTASHEVPLTLAERLAQRNK